MAFIKTSPKKLGEILQDQQEPFTLKPYLVEKGHTDSRSFLNKQAISATNKIKVIIPTCMKILRSVFSKLASLDLKIKNPDSKNQDIGITKIGMGRHENMDERFSSASSTTIFHSCSESDIEEEYVSSRKGHVSTSTKGFPKHGNLIKGKVPTDRNFPQTCEQENKQHSPVSVLEIAPLSDKISPIRNVQQNVNRMQEEASTITKRFTGDSISLASQCKLLDISLIEKRNRTDVEEMSESLSSDISSQYKKFKIALQQTKQLLFDCMREVVEKTRTKQQFREFAGPEDLGKLLCENVWTWSRQSMVGNNSTQLLNLEEWSCFEQQRKEIAMEIGDFILDDIINVIVAGCITD